MAKNYDVYNDFHSSRDPDRTITPGSPGSAITGSSRAEALQDSSRADHKQDTVHSLTEAPEQACQGAETLQDSNRADTVLQGSSRAAKPVPVPGAAATA